VETVGQVAVEAAVRDPRFPRLGAGELGATRVTVNVLGPMENLAAVVAESLPAAVTVGRHGIRVTCDGRVGLLLPEVAVDRDVDAETFLEMACRKAGLPGDAWTRPDASVDRFSTERFAEQTPAGRVVRESTPATETPTE
jgi:AmmeMemoRadiSam system protein A